jgi:hypothetical protein
MTEGNFFVIFLIVMIALLIDASISIIADIVSKQTVTFWGIVLFTVIAAISVLGQYFILKSIKAKSKESKITQENFSFLEKTMRIVQYVLIAIMVFVVLEIIVISHYHTNLLITATIISYGSAAFFMSLLACRLFSWIKINRSLVVLLYGLAAAMIAVNAIASIIINIVPLLGKPAMISPQSEVIFQTGYNPGTAMSVVVIAQNNSPLGYIMLTWCGTILLMHYNIQRVGRVKFWILVTLPLIYFMSYNISLYQSLYPDSPVLQQFPRTS